MLTRCQVGEGWFEHLNLPPPGHFHFCESLGEIPFFDIFLNGRSGIFWLRWLQKTCWFKIVGVFWLTFLLYDWERRLSVHFCDFSRWQKGNFLIPSPRTPATTDEKGMCKLLYKVPPLTIDENSCARQQGIFSHCIIVYVPAGCTGNTWKKQREAVLDEIRQSPNPTEVASLHTAGLSETAVEFVNQQSSFVHSVCFSIITLQEVHLDFFKIRKVELLYLKLTVYEKLYL